jgi:hypothetical protein
MPTLGRTPAERNATLRMRVAKPANYREQGVSSISFCAR